LFKILSLTKNIRILSQEREFAQFLLDLGNGTLNDRSNNIQIPKRCIVNANLILDITKDTYENIIMHKRYR